MKHIVTSMVMGAIASMAIAQTTYYYGSNGAPAGSARTSGNTTYYYGPDGRFMGNSR